MYSLLLDDIRTVQQVSTYAPLQHAHWRVAKNFEEFAATILEFGLPDFVSFDHDLAEEHYNEGSKTRFSSFNYENCKIPTGFHCAKWLSDLCKDRNLEFPDWQVHSMNAAGKINIEEFLLKNTKNQLKS